MHDAGSKMPREDSATMVTETTVADLIEEREWNKLIAVIRAEPLLANQALRKAGSKDRYSLTSDGQLAIHEVCKSRPPVDVVETLITANISSLKIKGQGGYTPLHLAVSYEASAAVVAKLIEHYPPSTRMRDDAHQALPLHLAAKFGASKDVVQEILIAHPEGIFIRDGSGRTVDEYVTLLASPLDRASITSVLETAPLLCKVSKAAQVRVVHEQETKIRSMQEAHTTQVNSWEERYIQDRLKSKRTELALRNDLKGTTKQLDKASIMLETKLAELIGMTKMFAGQNVALAEEKQKVAEMEEASMKEQAEMQSTIDSQAVKNGELLEQSNERALQIQKMTKQMEELKDESSSFSSGLAAKLTELTDLSQRFHEMKSLLGRERKQYNENLDKQKGQMQLLVDAEVEKSKELLQHVKEKDSEISDLEEKMQNIEGTKVALASQLASERKVLNTMIEETERIPLLEDIVEYKTVLIAELEVEVEAGGKALRVLAEDIEEQKRASLQSKEKLKQFQEERKSLGAYNSELLHKLNDSQLLLGVYRARTKTFDGWFQEMADNVESWSVEKAVTEHLSHDESMTPLTEDHHLQLTQYDEAKLEDEKRAQTHQGDFEVSFGELSASSKQNRGNMASSLRVNHCIEGENKDCDLPVEEKRNSCDLPCKNKEQEAAPLVKDENTGSSVEDEANDCDSSNDSEAQADDSLIEDKTKGANLPTEDEGGECDSPVIGKQQEHEPPVKDETEARIGDIKIEEIKNGNSSIIKNVDDTFQEGTDTEEHVKDQPATDEELPNNQQIVLKAQASQDESSTQEAPQEETQADTPKVADSQQEGHQVATKIISSASVSPIVLKDEQDFDHEVNRSEEVDACDPAKVEVLREADDMSERHPLKVSVGQADGKDATEQANVEVRMKKETLATEKSTIAQSDDNAATKQINAIGEEVVAQSTIQAKKASSIPFTNDKSLAKGKETKLLEDQASSQLVDSDEAKQLAIVGDKSQESLLVHKSTAAEREEANVPLQGKNEAKQVHFAPYKPTPSSVVYELAVGDGGMGSILENTMDETKLIPYGSHKSTQFRIIEEDALSAEEATIQLVEDKHEKLQHLLLEANHEPSYVFTETSLLSERVDESEQRINPEDGKSHRIAQEMGITQGDDSAKSVNTAITQSDDSKSDTTEGDEASAQAKANVKSDQDLQANSSSQEPNCALEVCLKNGKVTCDLQTPVSSIDDDEQVVSPPRRRGVFRTKNSLLDDSEVGELSDVESFVLSGESLSRNTVFPSV